MTSRLLNSLTLMLAFASTTFAGGHTRGLTGDLTGNMTGSERAALTAQSTKDILSLRAGASETVPPVSLAERTELARAAASAAELDALRAGEESNHDYEIAGLIVGIIVLALLIF